MENFPNKFTAEYLFLINQAESGLPRVTQAMKSRRAELDAQWRELNVRATELLEQRVPAFNKKLWQEDIGAIWVDR